MKRELHPAEIRGLRELYAFSRQLVAHWSDLAERIGDEAAIAALRAQPASAARELLGELEPVTAGYDLHGRPAAQGVGAGIARQRTGVRDRFLERGQALQWPSWAPIPAPRSSRCTDRRSARPPTGSAT